jgi:hypothetical protein
MSDVITLFKEFKSDVEKQQFLESQQKTITLLVKENKKLIAEVEHLKDLLANSTQLINFEPKVEKIIVTPEEALLDRQINLIQQRGIDRELTLEDTKKLDLLLKNKNILKNHEKSIEVPTPKKQPNLSKQELIQIALQKKDDIQQ